MRTQKSNGDSPDPLSNLTFLPFCAAESSERFSVWVAVAVVVVVGVVVVTVAKGGGEGDAW